MDHYENFKPRCTMDEAKKLKERFLMVWCVQLIIVIKKSVKINCLSRISTEFARSLLWNF